jgi:hypothetical protein
MAQRYASEVVIYKYGTEYGPDGGSDIPATPGDLWLDTTDGPPVLKVCKSMNPWVWEPVNTSVSITYAEAGSFQPIAADLTLAAGAGKDSPDTAFLAPVMGNVWGTDPTKTGNYLGGLIGFYSISGTGGSTYPKGAVLAGIGDGSTDADGAVVAFIDGDSAKTNARAAFAVMNNNSTPGSGFKYGLDLYSATRDGYPPVAFTEADIRFSDGTKQTSAAGPAISYIPPYWLNLPGLAVRSIKVTTSATGDVDLYTCPANKKAFLYSVNLFNGSSSSANVYLEAKIGSVYYPIGTLASILNGVSGIRVPSTPFVIEAGEKFAFSTSQEPFNAIGMVLEFDDTAEIKTARLTSLTLGDNVLYTCPGGKSAITVNNSFSPGGSTNSCLSYYNASGISRAFKAHVVASGGTAGTTNQIAFNNVSSGPGSANPQAAAAIFGLNAGDFVNINTDSGDATQFAWITVVEI